ncbi:DNA-3-methyladenine glycosylase I [Cognatishimia activa]|uniref:DNA-3-methyladenine glycosylase I n=1 Tax=Cognatishimia activa TaxID=1715691 RepID=A0A0P1ITA9_9RHOB|nr:DNA-3-methyladenine glycosylase I [Cognatishimia activa]CUI79167.1 DNA-3-methyladenine glycosylase I [Cognatishimia activa]CUK26836.1 DNA-3-methyladenine glycosylase I [Cognatishimia activa]
MRDFDDIFAIAAERKGGVDALEAQLPSPLSAAEIAAIPEDRWLAQFTKSIFQAGFNWKVIENKWPGFEEAFDGFDVNRCAFLNDEEFDALLSNKAVVRNGMKLRTVIDNAIFIQELRDDGGIGKVVADWPATDFIGLLELLKKRAARMGGMSAPYSLRFMGVDSFILSQDVTARLIAEGVIDKPATSKTAMRAVQGAFNEWMEQSGRGLTQISRVLAMSV